MRLIGITFALLMIMVAGWDFGVFSCALIDVHAATVTNVVDDGIPAGAQRQIVVAGAAVLHRGTVSSVRRQFSGDGCFAWAQEVDRCLCLPAAGGLLSRPLNGSPPPPPAVFCPLLI